MSDGTHLTMEVRQRAVDAVLEGMSKTAVADAYGVDWLPGIVTAVMTPCFVKPEVAVRAS
jgi:hypothetical protein